MVLTGATNTCCAPHAHNVRRPRTRRATRRRQSRFSSASCPRRRRRPRASSSSRRSRKACRVCRLALVAHGTASLVRPSHRPLDNPRLGNRGNRLCGRKRVAQCRFSGRGAEGSPPAEAGRRLRMQHTSTNSEARCSHCARSPAPRPPPNTPRHPHLRARAGSPRRGSPSAGSRVRQEAGRRRLAPAAGARSRSRGEAARRTWAPAASPPLASAGVA